MDFRIADSFIGSLARPNGAEQKAGKTTAFDLQLNASAPGLRFHRLDRARDPNFWFFGPGQRRYSLDRSPHGDEPHAVLCRASRQRLCLGRAAQDRAASGDRRGAARRTAGSEFEPTAVPLPTTEPAVSKPLFARHRRTRHCLVMACRSNGSAPCGPRTRIFRSISPAICHKRRPRRSSISRPERRRNGLRRRGSRSIPLLIRMRSAASASCNGRPRGSSRTGSRLPVGEMGGLPASGAAQAGRAELWRAGAHLGLGRNRQDDRRPASGCRSGAAPSRRARAADHLFEAARQRAKGEAALPDRERISASPSTSRCIQ